MAHPHLGSSLAPDSEASRNARVHFMPPNFCLVRGKRLLFHPMDISIGEELD